MIVQDRDFLTCKNSFKFKFGNSNPDLYSAMILFRSDHRLSSWSLLPSRYRSFRIALDSIRVQFVRRFGPDKKSSTNCWSKSRKFVRHHSPNVSRN